MHPYVVLRNVGIGFGGRLRNSKMNRGGNALREPLRQADFRPLTARPPRSFCDPLFESRQRKIQEHYEGELVVEKIVDDVSRRIITCKNFIEWEQGSHVQIRMLAKLAADLMHVSVELLQQALKTIEESIQRALIGGKVIANKVFKNSLLAIVALPIRGNLAQAPR